MPKRGTSRADQPLPPLTARILAWKSLTHLRKFQSCTWRGPAAGGGHGLYGVDVLEGDALHADEIARIDGQPVAFGYVGRAEEQGAARLHQVFRLLQDRLIEAQKLRRGNLGVSSRHSTGVPALPVLTRRKRQGRQRSIHRARHRGPVLSEAGYGRPRWPHRSPGHSDFRYKAGQAIPPH